MSSQTHRYMGAEVPLTTLPNGARTNADALERLARTSYLAPIADRVAPGVTVFGGDGFLNLTLIEGDDGLIVYDTGETLEDGERFLRQIRTVSDKPIVAVLYSHSHYINGTTALVGNGAGVKIIGHPQVNANVAAGAAGTVFPETMPLQVSRTLQQFNHFVPAQGETAAVGAAVRFGRAGVLPVDTPVQDGECMTIAGVRMQFFVRHGSDTDDCLTVHLPDRGVVLNNLLWPFMPNIYTLRGSKFRDPREWRDGLRVIRDLAPEVLVTTHARALCGRAAVRETLDAVIDALNLIFDQTLRGILRGLGPDDLRGFVRLPPHLAECPNLAEIYGEISHYGPYLYHHALGWFDGDAASINPLPPLEQARRLVDAMGGARAVLQRARAAFADREFAWALQLVSYLHRLDPSDHDARILKADVMEQMGIVTPAYTIRSWYVSQARALRGEIRIPRLQFPGPAVLAQTPPAMSIEQYRVRVDPLRAADIDTVLALSIADRGVRHALHQRRGVVAFVADPDRHPVAPAVEVETGYDNWLRFWSCKRTLEAFLTEARVTRGTPDAARAFFAVFDWYAPEENTIVPD